MLPNTAIVITALAVDNIMLYRTYKDIPDWTVSGAPGDGDSLIEVLDTDDGEHIHGGFIPGQRMVVVEVVDEDRVRIAAPNADRAIGDLNQSYLWYFDKTDAGTQIILTWRLPKAGVATIATHKLQVNDVLRVTQVTENPEWFSTDTLVLNPSSGLERIVTPGSTAAVTAGSFIIGVTYSITTAGDTDFTAVGADDSVPGTIFTATGVGSGTGTATAVGTIVFNGKVSCVVEPPGLPVVYDNDGLFAVGTAPNPLVFSVNSFTTGGSESRTVNATPVAGQTPYTYAWAWLSGGTGLVLGNAGSPTVSVTRTYTQGEDASYGGVLRVTVTDNVAAVATSDVTVSVTVDGDAPPPTPGGLTVTITPSAPAPWSTDTAGGAGTLTTSNLVADAKLNGVTIDYGSASFSWAFVSGGTGIDINSPASQTTSLDADYTQYQSANLSGTLRVTVTDQYGNSGYADVVVYLNLVSTASHTFTITPPFSDDFANSTYSGGTFTKNVTATPSGGSGSYTYLWTMYQEQLYGGAWVLLNPTSATCTLSKSYTKQAQSEVNARLTCVVTDTVSGYSVEQSAEWYYLLVNGSNPIP